MMYRTMETQNHRTLLGEIKPSLAEEEKKVSRFEALLNLTETIATLTIGAGFLLLVAACLATL